ncbi:flagellar basal body L-ring protein FlgH [Micavibrio aeruginosavorus]|uniref:Flagellar L-ring protein n=1 Tax=Micavibrio aeruginosavorus EPB TaxID=349215 RepID=M4VK51_9BACT|nr:flagellar basal body L-ring protein FlgH [Micavibrio aeruginosavorus]AGH98446.1 Flagellar L-ring protein FlgH [Micavibrio aeruginosavorus EPB]
MIAQTQKNRASRLALVLLMGVSLSACGASERLSNVGQAPGMSPIVNPQTQADYKPISMPMPAPEVAMQQPNSLWQSNRKSFFKDQRASNIGDILTVVIDINDEADLENKTDRTRSSSENAGLDNLLGYEASLGQILPDAIDNANLVGADADSSHAGSGKIEREEEITMKVAAIITQILPNGNMVIQGNQEVRVNFEKRILNVAGVIRPEDIAIDNSISYEKIAEARIIYGGEGQITDVQQPRYGQQVYDILFPF